MCYYLCIEKRYKGGGVMNKTEFDYEMKKHGDTQTSLADAMGLSRTCLNQKINEKNGKCFNQPELKFLKVRYNLTDQRFVEIFFASLVSKKDTKTIC